MLEDFDYRNICTKSDSSDVTIKKIAQMMKLIKDRFEERIDSILTTYSAWGKFLAYLPIPEDKPTNIYFNDSIPIKCYNSAIEVWTEYLTCKNKKFGILLEDANGKLRYWQSI